MPAVKVLGSLARVLQAVGVPKAVGKAAVKCGRLTHGARCSEMAAGRLVCADKRSVDHSSYKL